MKAPAVWQTVCLLLICLLMACGEEEISPVSVNFVETVQHGTGFSLKRPEGYEVLMLDSAIRVAAEYGSRITPTLTFTKQATAPDGPDAESLILEGAGQVFHMLTISDNPGSGGPEHELKAWRAIGDEWIVMEAVSLVEWPAKEADYDIAWAVLATVEVP